MKAFRSLLLLALVANKEAIAGSSFLALLKSVSAAESASACWTVFDLVFLAIVQVSVGVLNSAILSINFFVCSHSGFARVQAVYVAIG